MLSLAIFLSIASLLIWVALTFFRGAFWQLHAYNDDFIPAGELQEWPAVVAIVPARNEAVTIERTVESLLLQDYPGKFRLVLVDDHSADGTAELARRAAGESQGSPRVMIVAANKVPGGWTGKLWALQEGVEAASKDSVEYLWFTDADIVHTPDTLRRLVSRSEEQKLDLTSLMVLLQAKSFAERLLMPAFLYFFLKLYPPRWIADPKSRTAGAAGGCILLRRKALARIGGLAAIRSEVIDDCALASAVKKTGGAIWMGLTRKSVSRRSYDSFAEIRDLIARTAFTQLGYSAPLLIGTLVGMLLTYVMPVVFTFSGQTLVWRLSLTAWALMAFTYLPTVRFYGLSPLWAPLLPVAAVFYSYATWLSAVRYWLGRGGQWKGRAQAARKV